MSKLGHEVYDIHVTRISYKGHRHWNWTEIYRTGLTLDDIMEAERIWNF